MGTSRRFWALMVSVLILDSVFAESDKMCKEKNKIMKPQESLPVPVDERKLVDFTTSVAIEGALMALSVSNPLVGIAAGFFVGTVLDAIWPADAYDAIRAKVLGDIRKEMNFQSVERMKIKLRDYKRQIKNLFSILNIPRQYLVQWQNSVKTKGVSLTGQENILKQYEKQMNTDDFRYFKTGLQALTTDIGNDRNNFLIPRDPTSSLAYYREFATIEMNLLASELAVQSGDGASSVIIKVLHDKLKSAAEKHYRFVLWAAHKAAAKLESDTKNWRKYNDAVKSVFTAFPMQKWKELSGWNDDSKNIRFFDAISLKSTRSKDHWMSCVGSGSKCTTRTCPGVDNPFVYGNQFRDYYKCRGEVFWIAANGRYSRSYIRVCDKVGIRYSWNSQNNKGYWLSYDKSFWDGSFYNTRTCPGFNFFRGNFGGRCKSEQFTIYVQGKNCGAIVEDRDAIYLKDRNNKYVAARNPLRPSDTRRGNVTWRIYKIYSKIKDYH